MSLIVRLSAMENTNNNNTATEITKPKRVLTEAQRLAFLKGREKRMANIERRRQEKAEAQEMADENREIMNLETQATPPPKQEIERPPTPRPPTPLPSKEDIDATSAKRIADLVLLRLKEEMPPPPPAAPKKRKYTKKPKPVVVQKESDDNDYSDSDDNVETQPMIAPIPQKSINWM